jgi:hypothetical protein
MCAPDQVTPRAAVRCRPFNSNTNYKAIPVQGWTVPVRGWTDPVQGWKDPVQGWTDPVQGWTDPVQGSKSLRFPEYVDNRGMKVAMLSALHSGCLYPQESHQGQSAAGRTT